MGDQQTVVMKKEGYVRCDTAHATVSSRLRADCVGVLNLLMHDSPMCHSSPFGECDVLCISSLMGHA